MPSAVSLKHRMCNDLFKIECWPLTKQVNLTFFSSLNSTIVARQTSQPKFLRNNCFTKPCSYVIRCWTLSIGHPFIFQEKQIPLVPRTKWSVAFNSFEDTKTNYKLAHFLPRSRITNLNVSLPPPCKFLQNNCFTTMLVYNSMLDPLSWTFFHSPRK